MCPVVLARALVEGFKQLCKLGAETRKITMQMIIMCNDMTAPVTQIIIYVEI
jgi:hypothetical protein